MGRPKIVAGNWKMNKTLSEATALVKEVLQNTNEFDDVQKIFFTPFLFLSEVSKQISGKKNFSVGAQNCSEHASGAYTGETSASMLKSVGCSYVLVGHSERREYFKETKEQLIAKIAQALTNGLTPVFCFGEKLLERKAKIHFEVVAGQLNDVLKKFEEKDLKQIVLAYEPVWAIGTGETATPAQAQEMHQFVRGTIDEMFGTEIALNIPILYGGSCNAQNAKELFSCADVDGGLIGGASLKADDFCKIIYSF